MQHPHMVKLYDVFQVEKYFFRVIEFMAGGELFEQIVKKNFYTERSTCLVEVLLETIAICYDANVVHRDLKPENVLLSSAEMIQILSLDFGVATKTAIQTRDAGLFTACGTQDFNVRANVLFRLIKAGRHKFDSPYWDDVSAEAKDLIKKMLILAPAELWPARQFLYHQ
ncbi:unnamed protein product [Peronospora belbahrii]|uniref:Protein kinase domain-containing protein n=1 Tax=Peronospora belbahrii TaxID=622444 RepID=A0AAU9KI02_9STRA|nr:unnamed protein product [Peronospora belbahrii]